MKDAGDFILLIVVVIGLIITYFFLRNFYPANDYIYEIIFGIIAVCIAGGLVLAWWGERDAMAFYDKATKKTSQSYTPPQECPKAL